ncbi:MAG: hypothetical protein WBF33_14195, partial [Candidatus Nitrosopolaris sp.]
LYHYVTYKPKLKGYDSMYSKKIRHQVRQKQINKLKDILSLHRCKFKLMRIAHINNTSGIY